MGTRKIILSIVSFLLFFSGCGYGVYFVRFDPGMKSSTPVTKCENDDVKSQYYTSGPANPVILTHADTEKKKVYIRNAKETMKNFYQLAHDIRVKEDVAGREDLGREANYYVKKYVDSILKDQDVAESVETVGEIPKLYLLTAYVYYELAGYYQARYYLRQLTDRYEPDFLQGITTDHMYSGFNTVAGGVEDLQKKISMELMAKSEISH